MYEITAGVFVNFRKNCAKIPNTFVAEENDKKTFRLVKKADDQ